jgi:AbiU2
MGTNTKPEARFEYELEVFRRESDEAVQHLYAYLTMHAVAGDHKVVRQLYNSAPLFWLTTLRALQTSVFIVLGRIFSQDSEHNLDALLRIAEQDREIFSQESLARRKSSIPGLDVKKYVSDAYVPTADDFRGFRRQVREWRGIFEAYRAVRNQVFAHAEVSQPDDLQALFAKTNIQELEVLVTDLVTFHSRLQNLLQNGFKPTGDRVNSSVQELRKMSTTQRRNSLHGRVTFDTESSLRSAAGVESEKKS